MTHTLRALSAGLLLTAASAAAQTPAHSGVGVANGDRFGCSVAGAGDIDQDGFADVIVGGPFYKGTRGYVWVVSGRTGATLYRHIGDPLFSTQANIGLSVDGGGDANDDGVADYIYGSIFLNGVTGFAIVRSGMDGSILHAVKSSGFGIGFRVAFVGDVNLDGHDDFAASDPFISKGRVQVFSGDDGNVLHFYKPTTLSEFGYSLAATDLDGDLHSDLVIGAPGAGSTSMPGTVSIYSGANWLQINKLVGFEAGSRFGEAVAIAGDVDADGTCDIIVGAPHAAGRAGRAHVFSGMDHASLLLTLAGEEAGDEFGTSVDTAGDVDGDGFDDVMVGAPFNDDFAPDGGKVTVFSGRDGVVLRTYLGHKATDRLGSSVGFVGDADGGGLGDLVLGAPYRDVGALIDVGGAELYASEPAPGTYCTAKTNSESCVPFMAATGVPSLANSTLLMTAGQVINQQNGLLFWGCGPATVPFRGGLQCVTLPLVRTPVHSSGGNAAASDCSGVLSFDWNSAYLASKGLVPGQTVHAQFWYVDPGAPTGVGLTDAMHFDVTP
jgi:hypothetical protein